MGGETDASLLILSTCFWTSSSVSPSVLTPKSLSQRCRHALLDSLLYSSLSTTAGLNPRSWSHSLARSNLLSAVTLLVPKLACLTIQALASASSTTSVSALSNTGQSALKPSSLAAQPRCVSNICPRF